jgi:Photosystem I psaG / psaK
MLHASCTGLTTSDPGSYTAVDVLVGGSQGHVVATGVVLGLRAIGAL